MKKTLLVVSIAVASVTAASAETACERQRRLGAMCEPQYPNLLDRPLFGPAQVVCDARVLEARLRACALEKQLGMDRSAPQQRR